MSARILLVSAFPQTFIVQLSKSSLWRRTVGRRTCLQWWIDPGGPVRVILILRYHLHYNICLLWPVKWVMKCDRLHAYQTYQTTCANHPDPRERHSLLTKDTVHLSGRFVIIPGSSITAVANWDTLKFVARLDPSI